MACQEQTMKEDAKQKFRMDIFKLLHDELSVTVNALDIEEMNSHASTFHGETLTRILESKFGLNSESICDLGIQLAAQGRASVTLHCTESDLRAAQFLPSA
jgi:hypothetical protein